MLIMDGTELRYEALTVEGSREEDTRNVKKSDLEKYSLVLAEAQLLGDKKNMYLIFIVVLQIVIGVLLAEKFGYWKM